MRNHSSPPAVRVLTYAGFFHAGLAAVALGLMPFDERTVLGIDPWINPFKFMASLAVFEWTMAWFLPSTRRAQPKRTDHRMGLYIDDAR